MGVGQEMYRCNGCLLVPAEYGDPYKKFPTLDKAEAEGREMRDAQTGSMTVGGQTFPTWQVFFPCDRHLAILKAA